MSKRDDFPDPLPKEWLPPSPVPPEEDSGYWEARIRGMLAEAGPTLASYRRAPTGTPSWLEALTLRWRPAMAGALALAASAVVALALGAGRRPGTGSGNVVLSAIAGDGEPAALWDGAGVSADPTLAVLTLESGAERPGGAR